MMAWCCSGFTCMGYTNTLQSLDPVRKVYPSADICDRHTCARTHIGFPHTADNCFQIRFLPIPDSVYDVASFSDPISSHNISFCTASGIRNHQILLLPALFTSTPSPSLVPLPWQSLFDTVAGPATDWEWSHCLVYTPSLKCQSLWVTSLQIK